MNLSKKIDDGIKEAMKSRDKVTLEALRSIKKLMLEARSAKGAGSELTDDEVLKIISRLSKQGQDSASIYKDQGRDDLYQQEIAQVEIFDQFLPEKLSEEELEKVISELISRTGANSLKDMGKVMGIASRELAGRADGADIAAAVRKMLT